LREERERGGDGEPAQGGGFKVVMDKLEPLAESFRSRTKSIRLRMHVDRVDRGKLLELRRALEDFPGACPVTLQLVSDSHWHVNLGAKKILVDPSEAMLSRLELLFGEKIIELR
jgi:hypothetical protein